MAEKEKLFAFVLMPFDQQFDDLYKFGIKDAAAELGIHAERVDEQLFREGILERIYRQIDIADVVIAEMTGQNPNVFYEVGYAHGKPARCYADIAAQETLVFRTIETMNVERGYSVRYSRRFRRVFRTRLEGSMKHLLSGDAGRRFAPSFYRGFWRVERVKS